jgi:hypothetical protein
MEYAQTNVQRMSGTVKLEMKFRTSSRELKRSVTLYDSNRYRREGKQTVLPTVLLTRYLALKHWIIF